MVERLGLNPSVCGFDSRLGHRPFQGSCGNEKTDSSENNCDSPAHEVKFPARVERHIRPGIRWIVRRSFGSFIVKRKPRRKWQAESDFRPPTFPRFDNVA